MTLALKKVTRVEYNNFWYPVKHFIEVQRFINGDEHDPKGLFNLAEDIWEAWPYAAHGRPTEAWKYRFRFGHLSSFIKPYVKLYSYNQLLAQGGKLTSSLAKLPYDLTRIDKHIVEKGFKSLDDVASPQIFQPLWEAQLYPASGFKSGAHPSCYAQESTRKFWLHLREHFGAPLIVPSVTYPNKKNYIKAAADESKVIPQPVVRRLANILALHRDGIELVSRYHHLRLCILMIAICLGRRIDEVLSAPRCLGPKGPLSRYPSNDGSPEGALWFQYKPNKGGISEYVYISPEWEDIAEYCVRELINYGDEVRQFAPPEEQDLLILISFNNYTTGSGAKKHVGLYDHRVPKRSGRWYTHGLGYAGFKIWLNGNGLVHAQGIMTEWNITIDGSKSGKIYRLSTHFTRHTRQSALAKDPQIPILTLQRDLNHADVNMQLTYQHNLREENSQLLTKFRAGQLIGSGVAWLSDLLGISPTDTKLKSGFHEGRPSLLTERWRKLINLSPHFVQLNRVRGGFCALPQGPSACSEYMNCTSARERGCQCFLTDPQDPEIMSELNEMAIQYRAQQQESTALGYRVQAEKREIIAHRTENLRDEALRRASEEIRCRLKARQHELYEEINDSANAIK